MRESKVIAEAYCTLHDYIIIQMLESGPGFLRKRKVKTINPIIWQAWHILRTEDMFLNTVMFDKPQVFHAENWKNRLGIETDEVGTGMKPTEVDSISNSLSLVGLMGYNQSMKKHALDLLAHFSSEDMDQLDDAMELDRRLQVVDAFPDGVREERALAYAPTRRSTGFLGVIQHGFMHFGQFSAVTKPM